MKMNRKRFLGLAGAIVGGAAVGGAISRLGPSSAPGLPAAGPPQRGQSLLPNVVLRTHEDKSVRFYDDLIKGRTVLIGFTTSPQAIKTLKGLQAIMRDRMGKDFFMYLISLEHHETVETLAAAARHNDIGPGWLLLTGTHQELESLRRSFGLWAQDPAEDEDVAHHTSMMWYGIEHLCRWGACTVTTRPEMIARLISWAEPDGERPHH